MKLYIQHEGTKYYGYTLFGNDLSVFGTANAIFDDKVTYQLRHIDCLMDSTQRPMKGSSVNVIQDCALPVATIRNNYTIKRGFDTADYNVFSSQDAQKYCYVKQILLYPAAKAAIISKDRTLTKTELADRLQMYLQHTLVIYDDCILVNPERHWITLNWLRIGINEEPYMALLEGTLKKPCVKYDQLDITTDNVLTTDTLYIIYKLGMETCGSESNVEKLAIQVKALEQMNIDLYPGTMTLINCIFQNARGTAGRELINTKGGYDKATKRLLSISKNPISNDDYAMGQSLIETIVGMKDIRFTDWDTLCGKLYSFHVPWHCFSMFYKNIVKLDKKTINE